MPGDRKSSCGARMKPVGLMYKDPEINPFTGRITGELMIVHICSSCGHISCNRIAGDDTPFVIVDLLEYHEDKFNGFSLLTQEDKDDVLRILFGS